MSYDEKIVIGEGTDKEYRLPCARCLGGTRHKVIQSVMVQGNDYDQGYQSGDSYQIVQCQGCDSISFRTSHTDSEDFDFDEEIEDIRYNERVELYPSRVAGRHRLRQVHFPPTNVSRVYAETHSALCNKQPILAGIGIRALVETVCKEKAAIGSNLEQKIDNLVANGVLTKAGAETLHSMRILGNESAHEVKPHSEETLNVAMDVVEHMLNDVYILPAATRELPKRGSSETT